MRADRPIGTFLLLWPTLTALTIAGNGKIEIYLLIVFCIGAFLMRSAGCVINDYFDQDIDKKVFRTSTRPLATGKVNNFEALSLFIFLLSLSALLLVFLNFLSFLVATSLAILVALYPLAKRIMKIPQIVLGIVFSGGIPMAFSASINEIPLNAFILMLANFCWILSYDTAYAMTDRDDDQLLNIGNSAIFFKGNEKLIIWIGSLINFFFDTSDRVKLINFFLILMIGLNENINLYFYIFSILNGFFLIYSISMIRLENPDTFFDFFKKNNYIGVLIFISFYVGLN